MVPFLLPVVLQKKRIGGGRHNTNRFRLETGGEKKMGIRFQVYGAVLRSSGAWGIKVSRVPAEPKELGQEGHKSIEEEGGRYHPP